MSKRGAATASLSHWAAPAGLVLAVAGAALVFRRDFSHAFTYPKFLALGAGVWLAAAGTAASENRPVARTSLDAPLAACALALALSVLVSADVWLSLLGANDGGLWGAALLLALYWLTAQTAPGRHDRLLDLALLAYAIMGFYAVLQASGLDPFTGMPDLPGGRAYATVGSPVALGEDMTLFLPLALWRARSRRGAAGWAFLAAIACGLLASISRGAWLSSAAACGVFVALEKDQFGFLKQRRRTALAVAACLILACAGAGALSRRKMTEGDGGRAQIWRSAWELFKERPLLGWGANTFSAASRLKLTPGAVLAFSVKEVPHHAHDDLLHALATTGILGLCAYLWLWAALARSALSAARDPERPWASALGCGLLGLFLNMKVNPASIEALTAAAFFAGLLADRRPGAISRRGAAAFVLASATASLLLAGRFAAADVADRSGSLHAARRAFDQAARECARAVRLNPWEMRYRLNYVNALAGFSSRLAPPSSRNAELLGTALASAREAVRLHPRHPDAYYSEGIALLNLAYLDLTLRGRIGNLEPARLALDRALALDAHYIPTLQARRVVAEGQRDPAAAEEMTRRISEMKERERPLRESVQGTLEAD